jgi:hypothetical protein
LAKNANEESLRGYANQVLSNAGENKSDKNEDKSKGEKKASKKPAPNVSSESMADHFAFVGYTEMCDTW